MSVLSQHCIFSDIVYHRLKEKGSGISKIKRMKRVLTMTMNPCIDRTLYFTEFVQGKTNYVDKVTEEAAGKGINVAVGLAHLHVPVKALGFAYRENADCLYKKLEQEKVLHTFVEIPGKMRVNQKLFDMTAKEMTECNERGEAVTQKDVEQLLVVLKKELNEASLLVLSGSVPPGIKSDIYARMIRMAKEAGVLTILDASGALLREGILEKPYLIKPNKQEFITAFLEPESQSKDDDTEIAEQIGADHLLAVKEKMNEGLVSERMLQKAKSLITSGIRYVCISLGKDGVLFGDEKGIGHYPAFEADIKSLQGAGDALVAGFSKAIFEGKEEKMAEYALKMAASTIALEGSRMGRIE